MIMHTRIASYINFEGRPPGNNPEDCLMQEMYDLVSKLDNISSYKRSIGQTVSISTLRNAMQTHYGYTGNHSTVVGPDGTSSPNLMQNLTGEQQQKFVIMTRIGELLFESRIFFIPRVKGAFFSDSGQRDEMARIIHPNNLIASRTESINHQGLIGIHCDISNDGTEEGHKANLNLTLIVHADSIMNPDGTISSARDLGYSRKSLSDKIERDNRAEQVYISKFLPWLEAQREWRLTLDFNKTMFEEDYWKRSGCTTQTHSNGIFIVPQHFNKQATYLYAYIDVIIKIQEGIGLCSPITRVDQTIEMVLAMVMCNTAEVYRKVITSIWAFHPPEGNLCIAMANDAVEHFGSLSTGRLNHNNTQCNYILQLSGTSLLV
mmetsp:Transcript_21439/g.27723  ORF Transcript_21439/g.27723 Transcript_21439/m.27723 type:complete len:376 (-) Transcript_21439:93-1220(-)|eukprot:CAMPEP_0198154966 /NCGR_PEP_ID=MMETSP1443-20131203/68879_1 /TAXON_ID=186043 /ORGANISM="Entomoneis sp., Strain CCMP2396" /LENGTH=375 /DNA_ID=CAMNT_0043821685 /DNA_START=3217 /DNA_END=4344 /DNA_ORIENTATION=-